jgi:DHA1 family bicyclomycin/chloramphenicol resistance-like MFS transporter
VTTATPAPSAPPAIHNTVLMLILGSIQAIMPISIDLYLPALPTIAHEYNVLPGAVQFTLAIFMIGVAVGQLFYGPLTDKYGRKPPLYVGFGMYIAGAVICATAPTITVLIGGRFLQALGASAGTVISGAIARDLWRGKELASRLSLLMLVLGVAPILAPSLGGVILAFWDWHGVFWVLVGYGLIMMSCLSLLPETSSASERATVQLHEAPRAYVTILGNTPFVLYVFVAASASAMLMSYITSSSFLYIDMLAVTPRQFGIFFGINAVGLIGASQLNRVALRHFRLEYIAQRAFVSTVTVATLMLIVVASGWVNIVTVSVLLFGMCMSVGFIMPNIAALAFGHVHGRMGSASAVQGTIQSIVGGLAGTLIGVLSNGTMWPIVGVIGSAALIGAVLLFVTQRRVGTAPSA